MIDYYKNKFYLDNISIVGKLLRNTPKGLQPPGKAALKSQEPSFEPPSMVQLDSATIEKMLNQNKDLSDGDDKNHDTNINCVPLPRPENCSHSDDPMCHDEGNLFHTYLMTKSLSYRNQCIDFQSKSMDWFLYDKDFRHERVNTFHVNALIYFNVFKCCAIFAGEH